MFGFKTIWCLIQKKLKWNAWILWTKKSFCTKGNLCHFSQFTMKYIIVCFKGKWSPKISMNLLYIVRSYISWFFYLFMSLWKCWLMAYIRTYWRQIKFYQLSKILSSGFQFFLWPDLVTHCRFLPYFIQSLAKNLYTLKSLLPYIKWWMFIDYSWHNLKLDQILLSIKNYIFC